MGKRILIKHKGAAQSYVKKQFYIKAPSETGEIGEVLNYREFDIFKVEVEVKTPFDSTVVARLRWDLRFYLILDVDFTKIGTTIIDLDGHGGHITLTENLRTVIDSCESTIGYAFVNVYMNPK